MIGKKVHDHFNRNRIETRFSPCHVINPGAIQPHNGHHPYYQAWTDLPLRLISQTILLARIPIYSTWKLDLRWDPLTIYQMTCAYINTDLKNKLGWMTITLLKWWYSIKVDETTKHLTIDSADEDVWVFSLQLLVPI